MEDKDENRTVLARAPDSEEWTRLRKSFDDDGVVFILGAGVSYASKLPTWSQLVQRLAREVGMEDAEIEHARTLGWTSPTLLSVIRERFRARSESVDWPNTVRRCLYAGLFRELEAHGVALPSRDSDKPQPEFARFVEERNPTLAAVVQACAVPAPASESGWRANPRVAALLTYNIDALLQTYDRARHGSPRVLRTIERASKTRWRSKIPLYHLHGYLKPTEDGPKKEAADSLILCEDEYHLRTDQSFSFATTTILWALREFKCVFIGCSMSDELMRRSLFRSFAERKAALDAESKSKNKGLDATHRHRVVVEHARTSSGAADLRHDRLVEEGLSLLGARPLWVESYADLPQRLATLTHD